MFDFDIARIINIQLQDPIHIAQEYMNKVLVFLGAIHEMLLPEVLHKRRQVIVVNGISNTRHIELH